MKIRTGFISNSSSTSFCIKTDIEPEKILQSLKSTHKLSMKHNGCSGEGGEFEVKSIESYFSTDDKKRLVVYFAGLLSEYDEKIEDFIKFPVEEAENMLAENKYCIISVDWSLEILIEKIKETFTVVREIM